MAIEDSTSLRRLLLNMTSRRRALVYWKRFTRNEHVVLAVMAVILGAGAGVLAIAFRLAVDLFQTGALGFPGEPLVSQVAGQPWWRVVLAPAAGGLVIGLYVYRFMPGREPKGVAHVIEANALAGGRMNALTGIKAALVSAASIGAGASVGREGPVVHLGATAGSAIAHLLHLGRTLTRTLLGCGVAAAVAASFNAPIAGVFFALEVVVGHYALSAFAPIVIASVTGTVVSRMYYGNYPAFVLPQIYDIQSFWEFPAFALLGAVSAVAAIVLMWSIALADRAYRRAEIPSWARPALAGLLVGALAAAGVPHILGVGYEATDAALSELYSLWFLILLGVLKIAATAACLGAGFGGGIFSPSLFVGAMTGGAFGVIATGAFPHLSSGHGAYTIIGMGAVAGSTLGAPISTILMVFELTTDYSLTIAVMIATALASVITQQVYGHSFFTWQLKQRGINISGGREATTLRQIKVERLVDRNFQTVGPETPIAVVRERLVHAPCGELFVIDDTGRLHGTITFHDLSEAAFDTSRDHSLAAEGTMRRNPSFLTPADDLERAFRVFGASGEVHLPVVADRDSMRLVGVAHEHELMASYRRALTQARREERGEA